MQVVQLVVFVGLLSLASSQTNRYELRALYTYCWQPSNYDFLYFWKINGTVLEYAIGGSDTSPGDYVGAGWNGPPQMADADLTVVDVPQAGGQPTVGDWWSRDRNDACAFDNGVYRGACTDQQNGGTNDVTYISHYFINGEFFVRLQRPLLATNRFADKNITNQTSVLLSHGRKLNGVYQTHTWFWNEQFDLFNPPAGKQNSCTIPDPNSTDVPDTAPAFNDTYFPYSHQIHDGMKIFFKLSPNKDYIEFGAQFSFEYVGREGWFGLGFPMNQDGYMFPGDAMVVNGYDVNDYYMTGDVTELVKSDLATFYPGSNKTGSRDIVGAKVTLFNETRARWTRYLRTNDSFDYQITDVNKEVGMIYAFKKTGSIDRHELNDCGRLYINFATGEVREPFATKEAHGWLMYAAWGVLIPLAIIIARFMKKALGVWWFRVHIAVTVAALGCTAAGFGLIVDEERKHWDNVHSRLGLAVFILICLQPFLGGLADFMWDPDRKSTPIFPDIIHWIFGYSAVVLAYANTWLGLIQYSAKDKIFIIWGIHCGIVLFILFVGAIVHQLTHKE